MDRVTFEIIEHLGVLSTKPNGWTREINIVSWNGGQPKTDIREWDESHERMSRGITLTAGETEALYNVLKEVLLIDEGV